MSETNRPATPPGASPDPSITPSGRRAWLGPLLAVVMAAITFGIGLLAASIMERRWEAQRPQVVVTPLADWEPRNEVWGRDYPREYETWKLTQTDNTRTVFGGAAQRDYLEEDPRQVILFGGYPFSRDYKQGRGHYWARHDVWESARVRDPASGQINPKQAGTCWTCKSPDAPRLMARKGLAEFYATPFVALAEEVKNPIGCQDCHDPKTLNLRITRPALREAFERTGRDIEQASFQERRSLACAQCHVEYYFKGPGNYLTFPWDQGRTMEEIEAYYDAIPEFSDYVHAISKAPLIKMQHPDYELYSTGVHAYRGVSCADCHMPYKTEGGVKFTDHQVQSPLLNIATSCAVCHRWSEDEIRSRVGSIQQKVQTVKLQAEEVLVKAHFDVAAAMGAGATDAELAEPRALIRRGQMRWDFVSASNSLGFHSPQECTRILASAIDFAQQARLVTSRILARHGVTAEPTYPDISTRQKAVAVLNEMSSAAAGPKTVPAAGH